MPFEAKELIAMRRYLHSIPELGLKELETSDFLLNKIKEITKDCSHVKIKTWETGILVKIAGLKSTKIIGWRTDMDALPITEQVESSFKSINKGRMHACGHDFHMTLALGVLKRAIEVRLIDDLVIQFQPSEETGTGAKLMYESGVFGDWLPDEFYALHVSPERKIGEISTCVGSLFAGGVRFDITFKGKGGHAAFPHLSNDMIITSTEFIMQTQSVISRNIDPISSGLITIGQIKSGNTWNVIADQAVLSGTMRAHSSEIFETMSRHLQQIATGIATAYNCEVEVDFQNNFIPLVNSEEMTQPFIEFVKNRSDVTFVEALPAMTGEDFSFILTKTNGMLFWLGVESEYSLHHPKFNPNESALAYGVQVVGDYLIERCGEEKN